MTSEVNELEETWQRPAGCQTNGCVEVLVYPSGAASLRLTHDVGPQLNTTPDEWERFKAAVRAGQYD